MGDWWERRWLRLHAMVAPAGILATTLLLTYWRQQWQWPWPDSLDRAADLTDIGTVIYAVIAVAVERGVNVIFWALEERKKRRERLRAEGRKEGRAEEAQHFENWLTKVAAEKDIPLADLLPPPREDAR